MNVKEFREYVNKRLDEIERSVPAGSNIEVLGWIHNRLRPVPDNRIVVEEYDPHVTYDLQDYKYHHVVVIDL